MGWLRSLNDGRAISRGPRAIGRRAVYRGAMSIYAGGGRKKLRSDLSPNEQAAMAILVIVAIALAIALVAWLA